MKSYLPLALVLTLAVAVRAQVELATVYAAPGQTELGDKIAGIGDGDGDGVPDFVVSSMVSGGARIDLISGATLAVLGQVTQPTWTNGTTVLAGIGDVDSDGFNDFVAGTTRLHAYSGADGSPIWISQHVGFEYLSACKVGDIDNDGRPEIVAGVAWSLPQVVLIRGSNGQTMGTINGGQLPNLMVPLGDTNGNGQHEVATAPTSSGLLRVFTTSPFAVSNVLLSTNGSSYQSLTAGDFDPQPGIELMVATATDTLVFAPDSSTPLRSFPSQSRRLTVIYDLDGDGFDDLAVRDNLTRYGWTADPGLVMQSAGSGAMIGNWSRSPHFDVQRMVAIGDIDGDGFGDLILADEEASPNGLSGNGDGGWKLLSCKTRARTFHIAVQCSSGLFPPRIGITSPVLGQSMTIAGQDCPTGVAGTMVMGLQPEYPVNFGFTGCLGWWHLASGVPLFATPPQATWSQTIGLPNVPQLAGLQLALQAFFPASNSPIGFDLSNAIWTQIGY